MYEHCKASYRDCLVALGQYDDTIKLLRERVAALESLQQGHEGHLATLRQQLDAATAMSAQWRGYTEHLVSTVAADGAALSSAADEIGRLQQQVKDYKGAIEHLRLRDDREIAQLQESDPFLSTHRDPYG